MFGKTKTPNPEVLRDEIDELRAEYEQVLLGLNNDKARAEQLERANKEIEKQLVQKTEQIEALDVDFDDRKAKRDDAIAILDKEISELSNQRTEIEIELTQFSDLLQKTQKQYEQEIESGKKELVEIEKEITKLESKAVKLTQKVESLEQNKATTESSIIQAKTALSKVYEQIEESENKLSYIEAQAEIVTTRIEEDAHMSIAKVEQREVKVVELDAKIKAKENDLTAADAALKMLTDQIADLQLEKDAIQAEKDKVAQDAMEARKHHQHVSNREEHLRNIFSEMGMTYPEYREEYGSNA